jgi:predicted ATPase
MYELTADGSQFVISTHSPILLGYPEARIFVLSSEGIVETSYHDTEQPVEETGYALRDAVRRSGG